MREAEGRTATRGGKQKREMKEEEEGKSTEDETSRVMVASSVVNACGVWKDGSKRKKKVQ